ncbi:MAG: hypothetical protein L6R37_002708 [Teloschistes peruensis]|nr:MAG: hypothetical protein L6R37_002708 [Teloschistes peruensis]
MDLTLTFDTYSTTTASTSASRSRRKSSVVPGISIHSAIHATTSTTLQDTLISFLSYIKTQNIPVLPVTKPDIRTVLGQGASFLVNGVELPWDYIDPAAGKLFPRGQVVAYKRAVLGKDMSDPIADRIRVISNELLTTCHPPLRSHPNIVRLHGIAFETEGPADALNAMPVLVPEVAELGNLAEVLETARKEDRAIAFEDKLSLCIDIAHGLEILHACDIVHGDVKCENVLVFEREDVPEQQKKGGFNLCCKLTDFGVSRHPNGGVILGGSRPWQAPECSRGAYFKVEGAKRTDIYSFGMLLWRVMFDGDPFKLLEKQSTLEAENDKEKRTKRNEAVATLKQDDRLVQHVFETLAVSERFDRYQIEMLSEVISITLALDPARRELDLGRVIRLLTPNQWYESRHVLPPARLPMDNDAQLLDLEKWYSEFESASPVVQKYVADGFRETAEDYDTQSSAKEEEKASAAAYQLAICYANGFGVPFDPSECLRWCRVAAGRGSQKARDALPMVAAAFDLDAKEYVDVSAPDDDSNSMLSFSITSDLSGVSRDKHDAVDNGLSAALQQYSFGSRSNNTSWSLLKAAESCEYAILDSLLSGGAKPNISQDGVSPLHFLSSWKIDKAEKLGRRLIEAGADINARAQRGSTVGKLSDIRGGTPLMWSVFGDHSKHSAILLKLGADPLAAQDGDDALSFAARFHSASHLQLLLENVFPSRVRGNIARLVQAAAGGESRFKRIVRHGEGWRLAADQTLTLLHKWNLVFSDVADFSALLLPALLAGIRSPYGRINTDVQMSFVLALNLKPSEMGQLIRESVVSFNPELFEALLDYEVPISTTYEGGKGLLHLCARIPDHNLAATAFAPRLLKLGASLDQADENGLTPWMDAILERKWDLADLLMEHGANPMSTNNEGFNMLGLCILSINLGAIKYLLKYSTAKNTFIQDSFLVNAEKKISALQLAVTLPVPRAHGMKMEVMGTFLTILTNFAKEEWQINFRSDAFLPKATALEIAAARGHVHPVKNLAKNGAHLEAGKRAVELAKAKLAKATERMERINLERCIFVIENWDDEDKQARKLADDWTNMRTIDDSHVNSSWEIVVFDYKSRKSLLKKKKQAMLSDLTLE